MRLLDWLLPDLSDIISDVLESVLPKCGPKYEDDLIATLTKAHLGKLPRGKYAE